MPDLQKLADNDESPPPPEIVSGGADFHAAVASGVEGQDVVVNVDFTTNDSRPLAAPAVVKVWLTPDEAGYDDFTDEVFEYEFPSGTSSGSWTFYLPTYADVLTEGPESFTVHIQWDSEWSSSNDYELSLTLFELTQQWSGQIDYFYDQDNRLVARQERDGDAPEVAATDAFYYDDKQIVLKTHDGELVNRLVWGPQVDMLLADEQLDPALETAAVLYPLTDHLGTTRDLAVYDAGTGAASIASHRVFDAFGTLVSETDADFDTEFKFTGRYLDEVTGQQWNLNRWYDPTIGQWLSEDPIGFEAGDDNLSRYVTNDPIHRIDPNGLEGLDFPFTPPAFVPGWISAVDPTLVGQKVFFIPISSQWDLNRRARFHAYKFGCVGLAQVRLGLFEDPGERPTLWERVFHELQLTSKFQYPYLAPNTRMFTSWNDAVKFAADQQKLRNETRIFVFQLSGTPISPVKSGAPPYMTEFDGESLMPFIGRNWNFATLHCDSGNFYSNLGWYWEWMAGGANGGDSDVRRSPSLPWKSYPNVFYGVTVFPNGAPPNAPKFPWR